MATEAAALFVSLSAQTAQYTKSMDEADARLKAFQSSASTRTKSVSESFNKTNDSVKKFGSSTVSETDKAASSVESGSKRQIKANKETSSSMGGMAKSIVALAGAYYAYNWMKSAIADTADLTLATWKLQAITGMSAKTTSTWVETFKALGVGTSQVQMGFVTLDKQVASAVKGSKSQSAAFKDLGVSMATLKQGDTQKIILGIADGMHQMSNKQRAAADAQLLFSRNAKSMIPVLDQGSSAVKAQLAETQKYGAYISGDTYKALLKAKMGQLELEHAMEGMKITFAVAVLPYLAKGITALSGFILQMRDGKGAGGQFASAIGDGFTIVKNAITGVINLVGGFKNFVKVLEGVGVAILAFKAITAVTSGVTLLSTLLANPILTLGFAAIAGAAYLIISNWKTVGPVFAKVWQDIQAVATPVINWITTAFSNVVTWFQVNWPQISAIATSVFQSVMSVVTPVTKWIVTAFQNVVTTLGAIFKGVYAIFAPIIGAIVAGVVSLAPTVGPALQAFSNIFSRVFNVIGGLVTPLVQIIGTIASIAIPVLVAGFKGAWGVIKSVVGGIVGIVQGGFQIIKGVIEVFAGIFTLNFGEMWKGIKDIFSGAVKVLVSIVTGIGGELFNAAKGIIGMIGAGIKAAWSGVLHIMQDFLNLLLLPVNVVLNAIGVKPIVFDFANSGGGGGGSAATGGLGSTGGPQNNFTGGVVDRPGYFAGEEAPAHPEVILATNPKYRKRNLALWSQAGSMLNAPGFAQGGVTGDIPHFKPGGIATGGSPLSNLPIVGPLFGNVNSLNPLDALPKAPALPKWIEHLPVYLLDKVKSWMEGKISSGVLDTLLGIGGSGAGSAGPVFAPATGKVPAQVQWAQQAAQNIADRRPAYGHLGAGWGLSAYDCSSYVSTVMDAAGIWPKWSYYTAAQPINQHTMAGPGKWITIGTKGTSGDSAHTMMEINGHFFESSHPGSGPHVDSGWSEPFDQYRHPRGFFKGGIHQPTNSQATILAGPGSDAKRALISKLNPGLFSNVTKGFATGGFSTEWAKGSSGQHNKGNSSSKSSSSVGSGINHTYPANGPTTFSPNLVAQIAEWVGLPGITFSQIAHGESSYQPGALEGIERMGIGGVPVRGWGLWQITTGVGNDALINSFGGTGQMLNPLINAKAAKALFDQGGGVGPWHGTKYMTGQNLHYTGSPLSVSSSAGGGKNTGPTGPPPKSVPVTDKAKKKYKWTEKLLEGMGKKKGVYGIGYKWQDHAVSQMGPKGIEGYMKAMNGNPSILNAIASTRNAEQSLMDHEQMLGPLSATFLTQDSAGNWIVNDTAIADQMARLKQLQDQFLSPAFGELTQEAGQSKSAVSEIQKEWIGNKLKSLAYGIKQQISIAKREIDRLQKYIKSELVKFKRVEQLQKWIAKEKKNKWGNSPAVKAAQKELDALGGHHSDNIRGAQGRINQLQGVIGPSNDTNTTSLYGALNASKARVTAFNDTSNVLSGSVSYFDADTTKSGPLGNLTDSLIPFSSIPTRWKAIQDELDTVHSAMAALTNPDGTTTGTGTGTGTTTPTAGETFTSDYWQNQAAANLALFRTSQAQYGSISDFANSPTTPNSWSTFLGSFATGIKNVPMEGLALLHPGEAVIPAAQNPFTNPTAPNIQVIVHGDVGHLIDQIEVIVDGKKAEITQSVNQTLGKSIGQARQTPSSPGKLATY